jgi:hypothetical protein
MKWLAFVLLLLPVDVAAQTPTQGAITVSPPISNTNTPISRSRSTSSAAGGQATGGQGGLGGVGGQSSSSANPSANPVASSGSASSTIGIQTGNTTTNIPTDTVVRAAPLLYVPSVSTGNVCALGASAGASWIAAAVAFGASWESMQCERRQAAALLWNMGTPESKAAAKEVICNTQEIREAYARIGSPCAADMMRVAGVTPQQQAAPQGVLPPTPVAFDPTPYARASDCLMAAQRAGAPLSVCGGKP